MNSFKWLNYLALFTALSVWSSSGMAFCGIRCANRKSESHAKEQCTAYLKDSHHRGHCKVSKAVTCAVRFRKWRNIGKYYKLPGVIWYACVPKGELKQLHKADATATCKAYQDAHPGKKCWVKTVACGVGKFSLGKFGSTFSGTVYQACREHERGDAGKKVANVVNRVRPVVGIVRAVLSSMADSAITPWSSIPLGTRQILQQYYRFPLTNIRFAMASKVRAANATTWCYKIMFNPRAVPGIRYQIRHERWKDTAYDKERWKLLVHELVHGEQCERWGGEANYVAQTVKQYRRAGQRRVALLQGKIARNADMEIEAYTRADSIVSATWPLILQYSQNHH